MNSTDFFALYDEALNVHPHLLLEVGYTRPTDWMVHLWDATGVGIKDAKKVFTVQDSNRDEAFSLAAAELCRAYPDVVPAQAEAKTSTPWTIFHAATWAVMLPNGDSLDRFSTEAAAISARAHLRPMWAALVEPPADLYEAFHTDGKAWGFFDRDGNLHAQFTSRQDAQGHAARREDADYSA